MLNIDDSGMFFDHARDYNESASEMMRAGASSRDKAERYAISRTGHIPPAERTRRLDSVRIIRPLLIGYRSVHPGGQTDSENHPRSGYHRSPRGFSAPDPDPLPGVYSARQGRYSGY